jgi:hypothetical protein
MSRVLSLALLAVMMAVPLGDAADIDRTAVDFNTPSDMASPGCSTWSPAATPAISSSPAGSSTPARRSAWAP